MSDGLCQASPMQDHSSARLDAVQIMHYRPYFAPKATDEAAGKIMKGIYKPYATTPDWSFQFPIDWNANPFRDNNWMAMLHSLYMLDPLILQYEVDRKVKWLRQALAIVRDWSQFHLREEKNTRFSWYDMASGIRSSKIAWLYAALTHDPKTRFTDADRHMLEELAKDHMVRLLDGRIELRYTNHGLFQIHGLVTLCHILPHLEECAAAQDFIAKKLPLILDANFDSETLHREHSPGYHRFSIGKLRLFRESGLYGNFPIIEKIYTKARQNMFWLVDPTNHLYGIGDTIPCNVPENYFQDRPTADCIGMETGSDFLKTCTLMRVFDFGYISIKTPPQIAVSKSCGLFIQGAFHSSIHKHLDDLSFELFEKGQKILVDSGAYGYQASAERRYVQSTRAHNTIEIDHQNFSRKEAYAYGSAIQSAEKRANYYVIRARAPHPELQAEHERYFIYRPGEWLILRDRVTFWGETKRVAQWFHLAPEIAFLERNGGRVRFQASFGSFTILNLESCPSTLRKGRRKPVMQGFYSPEDRTLIPNYALGFIAENGRFDTLILIDETKEDEALSALKHLSSGEQA